MMHGWRIRVTGGVLALVVLAGIVSPAGAAERDPQPPTAKEPAGPPPGELMREAQGKAPPLEGKGAEARQAAAAFLSWAAASTKEQKELVRELLAEARGNEEISRAFCEEAFAAREHDHSRALVALALLGEMRSEAGQPCFVRFLSVPLPERGTVVEGEILERTALATLQAKAAQGLAYLRTESATRALMDVIANHPSRIVRAAAIDAYLWNHDDSEEAKERLRKHVREEDEILIDRVRRNSGERAESFNRKLAAFLKAHPEVIPDDPSKSEEYQQSGDKRENRQLPEPPDPRIEDEEGQS